LTIREAELDGRCLLALDGEVIDPPQGSELYEAICRVVKRRAKAVEVDLSSVELFGSAGINALLRARHEAEIVGCAVTVVAASQIVRRVLEITSLTELLGLD
jgi:anti-anti-sigma factor